MHIILEQLLTKKTIYIQYFNKVIEENNINNSNVREFLELYKWVFRTGNEKQIMEGDYDDNIKLFFKEISQKPLLSRWQEYELFLKTKKWDMEAKNKLIEHNIAIVISVAKKYIWTWVSFLDLIAEGILWLDKAIKLYDPSKWFRLSTYALPWIQQTILWLIAHIKWDIWIPTYALHQKAEINRQANNYFQEKWKVPTQEELFQYFNLKKKISRKTFMWLYNYKIEQHGECVLDNQYMEIPSTDDGPSVLFEKEFMNNAIKNILDTCFSLKESTIIRMRFWIDCPKATLWQLWKQYGITRERVRQIDHKVREKLKESWLRSFII